jgi:hypothetical protein
MNGAGTGANPIRQATTTHGCNCLQSDVPTYEGPTHHAIDSIPIALGRWEMTGLDDDINR